MGIIKKILERKRYGLEKFVEDVWWNRTLHMREERFPMIKFENYGYVYCREETIVPMKDLGDNLYAYYKVIKVNRKSGGDWLYDSDRYSCDMEYAFVRKGTGLCAPEKKSPFIEL